MSITFSEVDPNSRASQIFIELMAKRRSVSGNYLTPTALIIGQYNQALAAGITDYVPVKVTTADELGQLSGFGSEAHRLGIRLFTLLGGFSDGVWWCPVDSPGGTQASETVTFATTATSAGTYFFSIAGDLVTVNVASGDTADDVGEKLEAAITAKQNLPVNAANVSGTVTLTAKNDGTNGNEILVVSNPGGQTQANQNPASMTVAISGSGGYLGSGAGAVDIHDVFFNSDESEKLGNRFYTIIVCPYVDATNLGYLDDSWNARKAPGVKRPFDAFIGYVKSTYSQALAIPATINSEGISTVWDPRSLAPSYELAAAAAGIMMWSNTFDPGRPPKTLPIGIPFDTFTADLAYSYNDALFRAGIGYFKGDTGELLVGDLALSYRTSGTGGESSAWFDSISMHRRQQKIYEIEQLFLAEPYSRGVVADDTSISDKPYVIKPKKVVADICALVDSWAAEGWTKNAAAVKASVTAEINSTDNSRIDSTVTDDEALALRIIGVLYNFLY